MLLACGLLDRSCWRGCEVVWGLGPSCCNFSPRGLPEPSGLAEISTADVWRGNAQLPEAEQGITVLGATLGGNAFVRAQLDAVRNKQLRPLQVLPTLPGLQVAWLLLLYCASPELRARRCSAEMFQCSIRVAVVWPSCPPGLRRAVACELSPHVLPVLSYRLDFGC